MSHPDMERLASDDFDDMIADYEKEHLAIQQFQKGAIDLKTIEPSKSQIPVMAKAITKVAADDPKNATSLLVRLKFLTEVFEQVRSELEQSVRSEAEKHPNKTMNVHGATIEGCEVGVKYDYSKDPVWTKLNQKAQSAQTDLKERESILKALRKPIEEVIEEGEVITVHPPVKTSKSSIKITLGQ